MKKINDKQQHLSKLAQPKTEEIMKREKEKLLRDTEEVACIFLHIECLIAAINDSFSENARSNLKSTRTS